MRNRDDMTFSMEEHARRLSALRERMAERQIEVAVITDPENLCYLTEYQTTGYSYFQCLVVPLVGEPFMITRRLEETNVHARTWVELTRPYSDTGDAVETLWHALKEFDLDHKTIGYERNSYFFPAYQQDRMRSTFLDTRFVDIFGIVEESRIIKSDEELAVMKRAAAATEAGMEAGLAAVRPGISENEIAAEICSAMFKAGGEYPAVLPYVTSGPRTLIGHATWEGRKVEENEVVFLEVGGCYRRYHTAMMRTAFTGEPPKAVLEATEIVKDARAALLEEIRPGMTAGEVDQLNHNIINDNKLGGYLMTRAGYSIGIAFPPSWDEGYIMSLKSGEKSPLRAGMTMHLLPWIYGVEETYLVGLSETIQVTEHGCQSFFSKPPAELVATG